MRHLPQLLLLTQEKLKLKSHSAPTSHSIPLNLLSVLSHSLLCRSLLPFQVNSILHSLSMNSTLLNEIKFHLLYSTLRSNFYLLNELIQLTQMNLMNLSFKNPLRTQEKPQLLLQLKEKHQTPSLSPTST